MITASVFDWLYDVLTGDATISAAVSGRIYRNVAPTWTAFPYIVMQYVSGTDVYAMGGIRVISSAVVIVKAVGLATQYATLAGLADAIDEAISGAIDGSSVLSCLRLSALDYEEERDGVRYEHIGGQYSLVVQEG